MDTEQSDLLKTVALFFLCAFVLYTVSSSFIRREILRREYAEKCFEQTKNSQCWGISEYGLFKPAAKRGK